LWVLAFVAAALFLREASALCIPIAIAALLSFALGPIIRLLERARLPPLAAAVVLLTVFSAAAVWGAWSVGDNVARTLHQLPQTARQVRERMEESGGSWLERIDRAAAEIRQVGTGRPAPPPQEQTAPPPSQALWSGSAGALTFLGNVVVIAFLVFFFLATGGAYRDRVIALMAPHLDGTREAATVLDEITSQIERFVLVRLATAAVVGIVTWITLRLMSAPDPALWGTMAAVFNSIPFFGPVIVSSGLFVVGLLAQDLVFGIQLAFAALVITTIEGWLITPPLLGKVARMHTLAVLLGLLAWSWIWGIWGSVLAVPILTAVKVVSDHVHSLRPISLLLRE
jgi:predicted PurR-regulated permease PerM